MKKQKSLNLERVLETQRKFVKARDWEKFHTPKNIAMALGIEAAELAEIFLWLTDAESKTVMKDSKASSKVKEEIADVFFYLMRLSDLLGVDLEESFYRKMEMNQKKYPVYLSKGSARKYTEL